MITDFISFGALVLGAKEGKKVVAGRQCLLFGEGQAWVKQLTFASSFIHMSFVSQMLLTGVVSIHF